jgi:hypothetical protein
MRKKSFAPAIAHHDQSAQERRSSGPMMSRWFLLFWRAIALVGCGAAPQ